MVIGGLQKQSFIDWEGKTTAVIFTRGCNFRCGFCHNPSLVLPKLYNRAENISPEDVLDFVSTRKNWLDGVVITGGEPTLHADLPDFIASLKEIGLSVKLDTNGSNPSMLQSLITAQLIDYVAMDIKTKFEPDAYAAITACTDSQLVDHIVQSLCILRNSGIDYMLRTTIVPGFHTNEDIRMLQKQFVGERYVLQEYREGETVEIYR
ncbi:MAG: anaerobic ribonucleoside-triphosphate reductase activating protein [Bacteroidales bacterium]|jgi:pyruvate formate lyase activating enzyme|nr:anaerobic ribonucleoside-triphosphate reductase activating protein [Bacteroidales bacterium]